MKDFKSINMEKLHLFMSYDDFDIYKNKLTSQYFVFKKPKLVIQEVELIASMNCIDEYITNEELISKFDCDYSGEETNGTNYCWFKIKGGKRNG